MSRLLGCALSVLIGSATGICHAAPFDIPTGTWDCITSGGGQDGITFISFSDPAVTDANGFPTFTGTYINAGQKNTTTSGRNVGGGTGRVGSGSSSAGINLFGGGSFSGDWFFDSRGNVVGSYFTVVNPTGVKTNFHEMCASTNVLLALTNSDGSPSPIVATFDVCFTNGPTFTTNLAWTALSSDGTPNSGSTNLTFANDNFDFSLSGVTNSISFTGKVSPGRRLTLVASTTFGKVTYRGVPLSQSFPATYLDGTQWSGTKNQNGTVYGEFFHLTATAEPNLYLMDGQGPAYTFSSADTALLSGSFCLVSSRGRIAFYNPEFPLGTTDPAGARGRATIGTIKVRNGIIGAQTIGFIQTQSDPIHFDATVGPHP